MTPLHHSSVYTRAGQENQQIWDTTGIWPALAPGTGSLSTSPERWARTDAYPVRLGDACPHAGVEVICFNRALGQSPEDDLRRQVQGLMAEDERAKMIARHRRGTPHAARAGTVNGRSGAPEGSHDLATDAGHGQARDAVVPADARVVRPVCDGVGCDGLTIGAVWSPPHAGGRRHPPWQAHLGSACRLGDVEASRLYGERRVWADAAGAPAATAAAPASAPAAATARGVHA